MNKWMKFMILAAIVASPTLAMAADGLSSTVGRALCQVSNAMTSTIGQGLATLAVLFLGIGAFFGKVNWGLAVMVACGIALIFGATSVVGVIGATSSAADCTTITAT